MRPYIIPILLLLSANIHAQGVSFAETLGGAGNESIEAVAVSHNGGTWLAGRFDGDLDIAGQNLSTRGGEDVFCYLTDAGGMVRTTFSMGGAFDEEVTGIATDDAALYVYGSYMIQADFDTLELAGTLSSKSLFLCKFNENGEVQWGRSIEANTVSGSGHVVVDGNGDVLVTGYFHGILQVGGLSLTANTDGSDFFVLKLNADGGIIFLKQGGATGRFRAYGIALNGDDHIIVAGQFKGSGVFNGDSIATNTADHDVFVVKMDNNGDFLWGKKLGGVLEDHLEKIIVDDNGDIFLSGNFVGVLGDGDDFTIESDGVNSNIYLIRLDMDGNVIWGYSLGGPDEDVVTGMDIGNHKIALASYFQNETDMGLGSIFSSGSVDAIISIYQTDGTPSRIIRIPGDGIEITGGLEYTSDGGLIATGSFNENCILDGQSYPSNGNYDAFWFITDSNSTNYNTTNTSPLYFYPNPASHTIFSSENATAFSLFDMSGKELRASGDGRINLAGIESGVYIVKWEGGISRVVVVD